jgi:hypothetical protein
VDVVVVSKEASNPPEQTHHLALPLKNQLSNKIRTQQLN